MFEDRTPIWPGFKAGRRRRGPHAARKNGAEEYPWRVEAEPVLVLAESEFVAVESLLDELEHVRRWPAEHWHLAFQGQLRTISDDDAALVRGRMQAAAGAPATSA